MRRPATTRAPGPGTSGRARRDGSRSGARAVVAVLLCGGLALSAVGCGPGEPMVGERSSPGRAAKSALQALVAENSGTYTMRLSFEGRTILEQGRYLLRPGASTFVRTVTDAGGAVVELDGTALGGVFYARDPGFVPGGCWVSAAPRDLIAYTPTVYSAAHPMYPGAVVVAGGVHGGNYADDRTEDVNGTVSLLDVLALAGPDTAAALGVHSGKLDALLHIVDGVLRGITVPSRSFVTTDGLPHAAIGEVAGAELEIDFDGPDDEPPASPGSTGSTGSTDPTSPSTAPGGAEPITAPPEDQTVPLDRDDPRSTTCPTTASGSSPGTQ